MISSGQFRDVVAIILLFVYLVPVKGQERDSAESHVSPGIQIEHVVEADGSITIDYSMPEISFRKISVDEGEFYRLSVPGHAFTPEPGKPELPVYSRLISIPEGSDYTIRISDVRMKRLKASSHKMKGLLYPAQESEVKQETQDRFSLKIDRELYRAKGIIRSDTVTIEKLGKARNMGLATVNIKPARYNPRANTIEVITSMKVRISFGKGPGPLPSMTPAFASSLSASVMNYGNDIIPGFTDKPVGMVIMTDTAFRKTLIPYIKWKTQKGFRIKVLYKGISGNTWQELKDTLSIIYRSANENNPAPDYLLILGDIAKVPYYGMGTSGNITDMYYGEFDGNGDYFPEMYVGRLPARDTAEAGHVLRKIIQYEKYEFADTNTFHRYALSTTGMDLEHAIYMNGQIRYPVTNYFLPANNISEKHFYHQQMSLGEQKDSIFRIINKGTSFINYSGHGDASGWLHLNIKVADTALFKNRNMYPFIISNACRTSQFNQANSFGSRVVLEKNRGAVGFIGCSNDSYWDEDYYWAVGVGPVTDNPVYGDKGPGVFDRIFHTHNERPSEWYFTLGQINYAGNLSVSSSTSLRKKYYWEIYNVVGDPSMIPIIGTPRRFDFTLPDTLPTGIRSLSLILEPFSYIAISDFTNLWDASYASISGTVRLDIPETANDSCLIVVTGQNRYPLIKKVYFSQIQKEYLNLDSATIEDSQGNNNHRADFGERVGLSLSLSNLGGTDALDVTASISSRSPLITVEEESVYIGTVAAGSRMFIQDGPQIKVNDIVADKGVASIQLSINSTNSEKQYVQDITVHAPVLGIVSCIVDDSEDGNGDYIADPGETFRLVFRIHNGGSSDASGQLDLESSDQGITILETNVESGLLRFGEVTEVPVLVKLASNLPSGSYIRVSSSLICNPFRIDKDFTFRIGRVRETFESGTFSIFPWIHLTQVPWTISHSGQFEGSYSARSGMVNHNSTSSLVMKTYYPADDTLKFYISVSSEPNYDYLSFSVNGKEVFKRSGDFPWTLMKIPVKSGLNVLDWTYRKDQSVSQGNDCAMIDHIDFATAGMVSYIQKDLHVARITNPGHKERYGKELLSVKVLNTGRDTISGFYLAATINGQWPVKEKFDVQVNPGRDSVEVTFKSRADISRNGQYNIRVYSTGNDDDYIHNDTASLYIDNYTIEENFTIFPNPSTDRFFIFFDSPVSEKIDIRIADSKGRIIVKTERDVEEGHNNLEFENVFPSPGVYHVNVKSSAFSGTRKILHIK